MRWTPWWLIWMSWFNHEVQVLEINWTNISQLIKEINWTYILTQRPANGIHVAPTWGQRPLLSRIGLSYVIPPMWNCGMITHPFYKTTNDVGAWMCNLTSLSTYQCRANAVYPHHSLPRLKSLHQMEAVSPLLALCVGNPSVTCGLPSQDQLRGLWWFIWCMPKITADHTVTWWWTH